MDGGAPRWVKSKNSRTQSPSLAARGPRKPSKDRSNQTTVVCLDALNLPSTADLKLLCLFDGDPLDLFVTHHERDARCITFGMRQDPSTSKMLNVSDGALLFISQFGSAVFKSIVQLVEV